MVDSAKDTEKQPVVPMSGFEALIMILIGVIIGILVIFSISMVSSNNYVKGVTVCSNDELVTEIHRPIWYQISDGVLNKEYKVIAIPGDIFGDTVKIFYRGTAVDFEWTSIPHYTLIWWPIQNPGEDP